MASQHNKGAIRKQPILRKSRLTPYERKPVRGVAIPSHIESLPENKENNKDLAQPKLNSLLKLREEIENIESIKPPTIKDLGDLTPRAKSVIFPKINEKLNVDSRVPVFKNLVSLNVNDQMLLPKEPVSIQKKYLTNKKKHPAPDLADFLDPLPPLEFTVPVPEFVFEFPEYKFDAFEAYKRFKSQEIEEVEYKGDCRI